MSIAIKPRIDDIRFVGGTEETQAEIRDLLERTPRPATQTVTDLEWTDAESRIIRSAMWAIDLLLEELGLPSRPIDGRMIHVVHPEDIRRIQHQESEGVVSFGHAYIPRTHRNVVFAHAVIHELLHLTSFTGILCRAEHGDGARKETTQMERRLGTAFMTETRDGRTLKLYEGYNEAVTEILAKELRRFTVDRMNFTESGKQRFMERSISYCPHAAIVHRLAADAYANDPQGVDPYKEMSMDYFIGTFSLVRRFERKHPGSSKALARMGPDDESALECARTLGFHDIVNACS